MPNAFVRKLRQFADLDDGDVVALITLVAPVVRRPGGDDLVHEGERPMAMQVLLEGWACRYKAMPSGKRQIVGFVLPGDACNFHVTLREAMDHNIGLITGATVAALSPRRLGGVLARQPAIETALERAALVDEAVLREWLASIGRRDAYARTGHLICELWHRLKAIGQVDEHEGFDFPLTQEQLADALGLTAVHVNRMLKSLRDDGLIEIRNRRLTLLNPARLAAVSEFDPAYLHDGGDAPGPRARSDSAR